MQLLYSDYTHIRQLVSDRRQRLVLQNVTFQKEAYMIRTRVVITTSTTEENVDMIIAQIITVIRIEKETAC